MFDRPGAFELLAEARAALDAGVATGFPQKVVANALGIAQRELALGPYINEQERERLAGLLGREGDLAALNRQLADAIRDSAASPDTPALLDHLIRTTVDKLQIDQPAYPAFRVWKDGGS